MRKTLLFLVTLFIASCSGPMGPMGPQGYDGKNGADGLTPNWKLLIW